jgi:hypothetical protein
VDRIDLHVAEVPDRRGGRAGAVAERRALVEPLRAQPEAARAGRVERDGR